MFILRRITSENSESNTFLGEVYHFIHSLHQPEEFRRSLEARGDMGDDQLEIYAFIAYEAGSKLIPLWKKSTYYVMTESGTTFANITNRL